MEKLKKKSIVADTLYTGRVNIPQTRIAYCKEKTNEVKEETQYTSCVTRPV